MEFLRKNWGLLLSFVICLGVIIFLTLLCAEQSQKRQEAERIVKGCEDFFKTMNFTDLNVKTLSESGELLNQEIAISNLEKLSNHYNKMVSDCQMRYNLTPDASLLPLNNATAAREAIESRLAVLQNMVTNSKLKISSFGQNFGVDASKSQIGNEIREFFQSGRQITNNEVRQAFRQLEIYERLVRLLLNSGVENVELLQLPCKFEVLERSNYILTPLLLSVTGDSETLQNFYNALLYCEDTYFNVKSLAFEILNIQSPQTYFTDYFLARSVAYRAENSNVGLSGIATGSGLSSLSVLRSSRIVGPALESNLTSSSGGGFGYASSVESSVSRTIESGWVKEIPKRQDFLVYKQERLYRMDLNIDIVEFLVNDTDDQNEDEE